jgi:hypothetical protein
LCEKCRKRILKAAHTPAISDAEMKEDFEFMGPEELLNKYPMDDVDDLF